MPRKDKVEIVQLTLRIPKDVNSAVDMHKPAAITKGAFLAQLVDTGLFTYTEDKYESAKR